MEREAFTTFRACFSEVEDPRMDRCKRHELMDIIGLCLVGVICGCDSWVEIEEYGVEKEEFLRAHFGFENGIPSHDTLGRVMSLLNPVQFHEGLVNWTRLLVGKLKGEVIAIDGKAIRGSSDASKGKGLITMVSAWAKKNGLTLAHHKVDTKSNEIEAIPELLNVLDITDCIVTIDAMGTQKGIATRIRQQGGHYVLALKKNHPTLYEEVESTFSHLGASDMFYRNTKVDKGHGRIERRTVEAISRPRIGQWMLEADLEGWTDLELVIRVQSERIFPESTEKNERYYLSSIPQDALSEYDLNEIIRSHWSVENNLHWTLDVTFKEDLCQVRSGHADENLATLRKMALNLLKKNKYKASMKRKRQKAGWNNDFLLQILNTDL